jgi:prepilin-type N-terminal cleavage/methylation domain-containing protein
MPIMTQASLTQRHRGFTLVEILVVMGIIVGLAALIVPLSRSFMAKSRQASCLGNLRQIGIAIESYLQDHNDTMPNLEAGRKSRTEDIPVMENTLIEYLSNEEVFHCPEDKIHFQESGSSYLWNSTQSGRNKHRLMFFGVQGDSSRIPLVTDKEGWHPGETSVNILYADYSASKEFKFRTSP